ncbi:hypothetical protein MMB19_25455 [Ralstonia insidiosa]|nr:hypothetical protein MMB19_25455 [Ralstonia insidiosa]
MSDGLARSPATALPGQEPAEAAPPDRSAFWHRALAWAVAALLVVGLGIAAVALGRQADNGEPFNWAGWRDGTLGHQIEGAIDVPYARTLHRWQAALRYRVQGDLGQQVREGCPGWLFYADGLRPPPLRPGRCGKWACRVPMHCSMRASRRCTAMPMPCARTASVWWL